MKKILLKIVLFVMFICFPRFVYCAIPASERAALIALYNSTDGDNWIDNSGWKTPPLDADGFAMPGTENTWFGISVSGDRVILISLNSNGLSGSIPTDLEKLANLQYLCLTKNPLSGSIPAELGNLTNLQNLELYINQLSGSIPAELGNLTNLKILSISNNQLTGSIPTDLGKLANLLDLYLNNNQLSGSIPTDLGNMTNLQILSLKNNQLSSSIPAALGNLTKLGLLWLNSNQLTGPIPSSITNLTNLVGNLNDFRWNGLYTNNNTLRIFLNNKQGGGDWESTQTIAPENVSCKCRSIYSVKIAWTPITYTAKTGGYKVYYSLKSGGPYTNFGITTNKTINSMLITGLKKGETYYFVVRTQTNPHNKNNNTVVSEVSQEVSCTTEAPQIHVAPWTKDFGETALDSSKTFSFTVRNYGNLDLEISHILIYGPDADAFSGQKWNTPYIMVPDNEKDIVITFHPTSAGKKTATLEVRSNDLVNPKYYIPLEGTGVAAPDVIPPEIVNCFPPPGSMAIHRNSNIQFTLVDSSGTGVDSTSMTVKVNDAAIIADGIDQTGGQVQIFSHSPSYTILYDPVSDFEQDSVVTVSVTATDLADTPNTLDTTYTFTVGGAVVTAVASDSVDQNGGIVTCDTSDVSVTIPPGALDMEAEIQIGTADSLPPLPEEASGIGLPYHFGPAGLEFADSVTICIPYTQDMLDEAGVSNPGDLEVYYYLTSTGEWILLDVVGYDATCIQVKVTQFCYLITSQQSQGTNIQETVKQLPTRFTLHQNHPNPFNPETTISYTLSCPARIMLTVYNLIGQPVRTLINNKMPAGTHQVTWDAANDAGQSLPTGIYFYVLKSGTQIEMRKMLLMK